MNQPAYQHQAPTSEGISRHGHQLRLSGTSHSQLINDGGQHGANSPTSNGMTDPKQSESGKSRILEQLLGLVPIPRLRRGAWLCGWQVGEDGALFVFGEELAGLRVVGEEEVGVQTT